MTGHAMEIYGDHMQAIAELIAAIDAWEKKFPTIMIESEIAVRHVDTDPGEIYGHLVDVIGGAWCFRPKVTES